MALEFYGLKSCDTCKKALKALDAAGREVSVIDVRADGVPSEKMAAWIAEIGAAPLVNTRSTTWRGLGEEDRAGADSPDGALALLQAHPTLMKRPVIVAEGAVHVGWTPAVQAALLG